MTKLYSKHTCTHVCIIYYFHSFFLPPEFGSIQMRRDNFSLFDSDTESIQVQQNKKKLQPTLRLEQKSLVYTTFAGCLNDRQDFR